MRSIAYRFVLSGPLVSGLKQARFAQLSRQFSTQPQQQRQHQVQFDVLPLASSMNASAEVKRRSNEMINALSSLGGRVISDISAAQGPVCLLALTGGSEHPMLQAAKSIDGPIVLVAHSTDNSLPAAMETLARLHQDGRRGEVCWMASPEDASDLTRLRTAMQSLSAWRTLSRARIGVVGTPSDWLVASAPSAEAVKASWGATLVPMDMKGLMERFAGTTDDRLAEDVLSKAKQVVEPTASHVRDAARVLPALQWMIEQHKLDAITVRCFDLVTELGTSGCLALSQLNDMPAMVAGCEGDIVSTVGMMWAKALVGASTWMANPVGVDPDANQLRLAHCTIARSLTTSYELRSHFESNKSVGLAAQPREGPVTLLRLGGTDMRSLWMAEGELRAPSHNDPRQCRTQAIVTLDTGNTVSDMLSRPLGNHIICGWGRHHSTFKAWWDLCIKPITK